MKTELLFPTPVWIENKCGIDRDKLLDFAYFVRDEDPDGRVASNEGGWQSHDFIDEVMRENPLSELRFKILELAYAACDEWGFLDYSLRISNLWININKRGDSNLLHTHPGSVLAGVYYLKVPECCMGPLTLLRDFREQQMKECWGNASNFERWEGINVNEYDIYPEDDKMILFPSWVPHAVGKSNSDDDRISISFNIIPFSNHYHAIYPTR
jgi:uncharacterized protein (TIGR02466 family)